MKGRPRLFFRWGAVVAYSALIFFLSSLNDLHEFDDVSWFDFEGKDKVEHGIAYAVWALIFSSARAATWPASEPTAVLTATSMGILYGVSDEIHQRYVPGRTASLYDLAADAAGSLAGALLHAAWSRRRRRLRDRAASRQPPAESA